VPLAGITAGHAVSESEPEANFCTCCCTPKLNTNKGKTGGELLTLLELISFPDGVSGWRRISEVYWAPTAEPSEAKGKVFSSNMTYQEI
jgi:hypothetical protein